MIRQISALILGAGQARRMGRIKALLPLPLLPDGGDCSALEGLARLYRGEGVSDILVVTGFHADEVAAECQRLGLAHVRNPRPEEGMFSSVRVGLAALAERGLPDAFFFNPVDVPLVRALTLKTLAAVMDEELTRHCNRPAVLVPVFAGREGHPPLIPGVHLRRILAYGGENGLRGAQATLPRHVVAVPDALILEDMDTPKDHARLRLLAGQRGALSPEEVWVLLRQRGTADKIMRHSRAVARVTVRFAETLMQSREAAGLPAGCDRELAAAGALAHDICKGAPHHDLAAADLLDSLGLPVLADIARSHLDLTLPEDAPLTERELVYLADKYCAGVKFSALENRFAQKLQHFIDNPEATAAILGRLDRARALAARLERECGQNPALMAQEALAAGQDGPEWTRER